VSTVIPIPVAMIAAVVTLLVAGQLDAPPELAGAAAVAVGVGVGLGWARSPRFPNGGGPI
jgi:hypothetical protein